MKRQVNQRGFTLIELLVVIAIIALLSSVVLASLSTARAKARYARTLADVRAIQLAAEQYVNTQGIYPADVSMDTMPAGLSPDYLSTWPKAQCSGWKYDYEGWLPPYGGMATGTSIYRVTLRKANNTVFAYYCIYSDVPCSLPGEALPPNSDLRDYTPKQITCSE